MKISLTGRPGKIVSETNVVITTMQQSKIPTLPKGLPMPPEVATTYVLYITRKQWDRLGEGFKEDPEDFLIVEGYPFYDKELKSLAVFATRTTTKLLERERRLAQQAESEAMAKAQDATESEDSPS